MLKSILIGVDGSSSGSAAIDLGIRWAWNFGATLVGMGIVNEPAICGPEPVPLGATAFKCERDEMRLAAARRNAEDTLQSFGARCAIAGVSYEALVAIGDPAEQMAIEAQRFDAVVFAQRDGVHFETQPGDDRNTLRNVAKRGPRPIVAVPALPRGGRNIVVAYDGSLQAARTLQLFQGLGLCASGEVHAVSVHPDEAEAARVAGRAVDYLRRHEIAAHSHAVAAAPEGIAAALLERVENLDAGLLVMGAYGRPVLKELFFGSVTQQILDAGAVSVFLSH